MRRSLERGPAPSSRHRPLTLGHPGDDVDGILDFAEREIHGARSRMDLRIGAEMLYLGLASSLDRLAKRTITSSRERRAVLARLGKRRPEMPRTFANLKVKLQRECFHGGRCSRAGLAEAVVAARKFVRCLPGKLPW